MASEQALATRPSTAVSDVRASREQLVADTLCRGGTPEEIDVFLLTARRLGLDPLARQIFAVKRWDSQLKREVMTPQVSIDGMRLVAHRSGQYEGQRPQEWCGSDGVWRDVWLSDAPPAAARCGVYRSKCREAITAVANYSEYVQRTKDGRPNSMWQKYPALMLSKCAESLALRKSFPDLLSGVYSVDEMGTQSVDSGPVLAGEDVQLVAVAASIDQRKIDALIGSFSEFGLSEKDVLAGLAVNSVSEITSKHVALARRKWRELKDRYKDQPPHTEEDDPPPYASGDGLDDVQF